MVKVRAMELGTRLTARRNYSLSHKKPMAVARLPGEPIGRLAAGTDSAKRLAAPQNEKRLAPSPIFRQSNAQEKQFSGRQGRLHAQVSSGLGFAGSGGLSNSFSDRQGSIAEKQGRNLAASPSSCKSHITRSLTTNKV